MDILQKLTLLQGKKPRNSPKTQRTPHVYDIFPELSDSFHAPQSQYSTSHTAPLHNTSGHLYLSETLEQDNLSRDDSLARREQVPTHDTLDCSPSSQNFSEVVVSADVDSPVSPSAVDPRATARNEASLGSIPTHAMPQPHSSSTTALFIKHPQRDGSNLVDISTAPVDCFDDFSQQTVSDLELTVGQTSLTSRPRTTQGNAVDQVGLDAHLPDETVIDRPEKEMLKTKEIHDLAVLLDGSNPSSEDTESLSLLSLSSLSQRTLERRDENYFGLNQFPNGQSSAESVSVLFSIVDSIHRA